VGLKPRSCFRSVFLKLLAVLTLSTAPVGCWYNSNISDLAPVKEQPAIERTSIAHRGNLHKGYPDNSIPALTQTLSAGVSFAEVDVRRSSAGELFLFHDGSVQTHNSFAPPQLEKRKVQELTQGERAQVWLNSERSIAIPNLREALDLLKQFSGTLQLDLKGESDELLNATLEEVRKAGALSRVTIQLKDPGRFALIRKREPKARIVARCLDSEQLSKAIAAKVEAVELERWITEDAVRSAHAAGVRVIINIASSHFDEPKSWEYLRSRGVDTLMSDYADRASLAPTK
jgi:glycerophosphoryl diester phosphodiesterase